MGNAGDEEVVLKNGDELANAKTMMEVSLDYVKSYENVVSMMAGIEIEIQKCKDELDFINTLHPCNDIESRDAMMKLVDSSLQSVGLALARIVKVSECAKKSRR